MADKQHAKLLLSAIVPSTLCFLAACIPIIDFVFGSLPSKNYLLFFSCVLGCTGYFGLISLYRNKFNAKVSTNLIRLIAGFIGYILIYFWTGLTLEDLILIPKDIWDLLILVCAVWILFIYVFYIILLSKKIFQ